MNPVIPAPDPQVLIESARACIPQLREWAAVHDESRRLSDDAARLLRERGFFRICQSVENGGWGMRPSVLWRVTCEVARGDPACAWVLGLAGLHPWLAGMFLPQAQDEVFANGRDAIVIALTGNVGRGVQARREGDDFVLDGKWTYASGIDVADWACVLVEVPTAGEGTELRLMLVPQSHFQIDHDSWDVYGMRGTGSKDVYLQAERVPGYRTIAWADVQALRYPGAVRNQGPMSATPHTSLFVMSVAAPIVGVGYGLLDLAIDTMRRRRPAGLQTAQTQDRFSLSVLGQCASQLDMAFQQLMHDVDAMWDQAAAGEPFTIEQRTRYRMHGASIVNTVMEASQALVRQLGGSVLPRGPIERTMRDLQSMASHFLIQTNPSAEWLGSVLLEVPLPAGARI